MLVCGTDTLSKNKKIQVMIKKTFVRKIVSNSNFYVSYILMSNTYLSHFHNIYKFNTYYFIYAID